MTTRDIQKEYAEAERKLNALKAELEKNNPEFLEEWSRLLEHLS